jgi:hypothetical protein
MVKKGSSVLANDKGTIQSKAKQSKIMSGHDANPIYASCQFSQQCS